MAILQKVGIFLNFIGFLFAKLYYALKAVLGILAFLIERWIEPNYPSTGHAAVSSKTPEMKTLLRIIEDLKVEAELKEMRRTFQSVKTALSNLDAALVRDQNMQQQLDDTMEQVTSYYVVQNLKNDIENLQLEIKKINMEMKSRPLQTEVPVTCRNPHIYPRTTPDNPHFLREVSVPLQTHTSRATTKSTTAPITPIAASLILTNPTVAVTKPDADPAGLSPDLVRSIPTAPLISEVASPAAALTVMPGGLIQTPAPSSTQTSQLPSAYPLFDFMGFQNSKPGEPQQTSLRPPATAPVTKLLPGTLASCTLQCKNLPALATTTIVSSSASSCSWAASPVDFKLPLVCERSRAPSVHQNKDQTVHQIADTQNIFAPPDPVTWSMISKTDPIKVTNLDVPPAACTPAIVKPSQSEPIISEVVTSPTPVCLSFQTQASVTIPSPAFNDAQPLSSLALTSACGQETASSFSLRPFEQQSCSSVAASGILNEPEDQTLTILEDSPAANIPAIMGSSQTAPMIYEEAHQTNPPCLFVQTTSVRAVPPRNAIGGGFGAPVFGHAPAIMKSHRTNSAADFTFSPSSCGNERVFGQFDIKARNSCFGLQSNNGDDPSADREELTGNITTSAFGQSFSSMEATQVGSLTTTMSPNESITPPDAIGGGFGAPYLGHAPAGMKSLRTNSAADFTFSPSNCGNRHVFGQFDIKARNSCFGLQSNNGNGTTADREELTGNITSSAFGQSFSFTQATQVSFLNTPMSPNESITPRSATGRGFGAPVFGHAPAIMKSHSANSAADFTFSPSSCGNEHVFGQFDIKASGSTVHPPSHIPISNEPSRLGTQVAFGRTQNSSISRSRRRRRHKRRRRHRCSNQMQTSGDSTLRRTRTYWQRAQAQGNRRSLTTITSDINSISAAVKPHDSFSAAVFSFAPSSFGTQPVSGQSHINDRSSSFGLYSNSNASNEGGGPLLGNIIYSGQNSEFRQVAQVSPLNTTLLPKPTCRTNKKVLPVRRPQLNTTDKDFSDAPFSQSTRHALGRISSSLSRSRHWHRCRKPYDHIQTSEVSAPTADRGRMCPKSRIVTYRPLRGQSNRSSSLTITFTN